MLVLSRLPESIDPLISIIEGSAGSQIFDMILRDAVITPLLLDDERFVAAAARLHAKMPHGVIEEFLRKAREHKAR